MGFRDAITRVFGRQPVALPAQKLVPPSIRFADFSEYPPEELVPYLDRSTIDESTLTPAQAEWRRDGVVHLPGFIPDDITEPYIKRREAHHKQEGWLIGSPYMHIPEIRDLALYPPLMAKMQELIGDEMFLHLCLTAWMSTQRGWHQDDYLNPEFVNSWYTAAWIALGDIHPDSGPFEYIPGSHRWPLMRGEKIRNLLTEEELSRRAPGTGFNHWEKFSERFVTPAIDYEVAMFGKPPVPFLAKRGDVLIWHGRLIHRGAIPKIQGMERRSLIAHYSAIHHREDMPERAQDHNGQTYAVFNTPLVS